MVVADVTLKTNTTNSKPAMTSSSSKLTVGKVVATNVPPDPHSEVSPQPASTSATTVQSAANSRLLINSQFPNFPRIWKCVEINLENSLLSEEKLSNPPSLSDGMPAALEQDLRFLGCELIQSASIMLRLPQVAAATGQILYQRFYYSKSFVRYFFEHTAMACVNLASRIEEAPRRIRDVINVFHHLKQLYKLRANERRLLNKKRVPAPLVIDAKYSCLKNDVIRAERRVLKELGFCCHVKHPHKLIYVYLQALKSVENQAFLQKSWNYMNDSLRCDIFLRYSPESVACACIHLASLDLKIPLPRIAVSTRGSKEPVLNWWMLFTTDPVPEISLMLLKLYAARRKRPSWVESEARVNKLRRRIIEQQAANKISGGIENTPNPHAAPVQPSIPANNAEKSKDPVDTRNKTSSEQKSNNKSMKKEDDEYRREKHSKKDKHKDNFRDKEKSYKDYSVSDKKKSKYNGAEDSSSNKYRVHRTDDLNYNASSNKLAGLDDKDRERRRERERGSETRKHRRPPSDSPPPSAYSDWPPKRKRGAH